MALPIIKTTDRVRLVYSGDPSISAGIAPKDYAWRAATPEDAAKGATVVTIRPVSSTEYKQASIKAEGSHEAHALELLSVGYLGSEGDARPVAEQIEGMPSIARSTLGAAIARLSGDVRDPFGQRSCG